jgi:hypothetical protein
VFDVSGMGAFSSTTAATVPLPIFGTRSWSDVIVRSVRVGWTDGSPPGGQEGDRLPTHAVMEPYSGSVPRPDVSLSVARLGGRGDMGRSRRLSVPGPTAWWRTGHHHAIVSSILAPDGANAGTIEMVATPGCCAL